MAVVFSSPARVVDLPGLRKQWLTPLLVLFCLVAAVPAFADALTASVDRTAISPNESLTLTVRYDGQAIGDPDFSDLERDFRILSNQRQSQLSFGSGANRSYTQWVLTLMPKRTGELVIPSFNFKGQVSDAVPIAVDNSRPAAGNKEPVFVETDVDEKRVYVGQQILLTQRLYTAVNLTDLSVTPLDVGDAQAVKVHETQYQKRINGVDYSVIEIRYALFPENPGELTIPPARFTGVKPDRADPFAPFGRSFFNRGGKRIVLATEEQRIEVLPKPASLSGPWLPSKGLSLAQRWSHEPGELTVGEPATRSIIISAQGLQGAQLPPLPTETSPELKTYPDQPTIENQTSESGVVGTRIESVALVATRPGKITLPPVTVTWWDTVSNRLRTTELEAVTLNILPAPQSGSTAPSGSAPTITTQTSAGGPSSGYSPLFWAMVASNSVLALATLTFALLWWRQRQITPAKAVETPPDNRASQEKAAFAEVKARQNQALALFRDAILRWSQIYWPEAHPKTLNDIIDLCGDVNLKRHFDTLDRQLYGTGSEQEARASTATIVSLLENLRQQKRRTRQTGQDGLPPLYPDTGQN